MVWAAAHFGHAGGYGLAAVAGIAATGYVQGVIAFRTGRLAPTILIHAAGNTLVVLLLVLDPAVTAAVIDLLLLALILRLLLSLRRS